MMHSSILVALSALVVRSGLASAKKTVQHAAFSAQMYESGAVMEQIMETKMVNFSINNISLLMIIDFLDRIARSRPSQLIDIPAHRRLCFV